MEDDLKKNKKGRRPQKKMKMEDDLNNFFEKLEWRPQKIGRRPQEMKNERRPQKNGRWPQSQ